MARVIIILALLSLAAGQATAEGSVCHASDFTPASSVILGVRASDSEIDPCAKPGYCPGPVSGCCPQQGRIYLRGECLGDRTFSLAWGGEHTTAFRLYVPSADAAVAVDCDMDPSPAYGDACQGICGFKSARSGERSGAVFGGYSRRSGADGKPGDIEYRGPVVDRLPDCCGDDAREYLASTEANRSCDGTEACCDSPGDYSQEGWCVKSCIPLLSPGFEAYPSGAGGSANWWLPGYGDAGGFYGCVDDGVVGGYCVITDSVSRTGARSLLMNRSVRTRAVWGSHSSFHLPDGSLRARHRYTFSAYVRSAAKGGRAFVGVLIQSAEPPYASLCQKYGWVSSSWANLSCGTLPLATDAKSMSLVVHLPVNQRRPEIYTDDWQLADEA